MGRPTRRKADFDWMLAYSPYDNPPPAGGRPDLLVTGAVHDPRVMVREPAKWVAMLRETDPEWSPRCLFRCETGAGAHVGPSGRFAHLAYEAEVYAWLLDRLGVAVVTPAARGGHRGRPGADPLRHQQRARGRPRPAAGQRDRGGGVPPRLPERRGVDCELVARDPRRANLVARIPGTGEAPSLAFVGHLDVVPADPRDWTHPPFAAVVDEGGWLWGRGAIDMKNEVAARAVAMAELARSGFRPRGDLWLIAVADEEDGRPTSACAGCSRRGPTSGPDLAINEGGGERLPLADGRVVQTVSVGEKGTYPARVVAVGEAGHASTPDVGDNAVPLLGELLRRVGRGMPTPEGSPHVDRMLEVLLGVPVRRPRRRAARGGGPAPGAGALDPRPGRHHDGADAC